MRRILFPILTLVAIVCGCARELEPEGSGIAPASEYLVISADCAPMTKSDINQGKSTWEKGDKIAVIYKGATYEYVAGAPSADGKQTYFTSSAGISNYDGSALTAYYQPLDAEAGLVGLAASREIEFQKEGQVNSACAPLVGVSGTMQDGVLNMWFRNIFSVVELRIDAAGYHLNSPAKTLKVEPAEGGSFSGYITCSGQVDPSTLALETSQTGNALTLNLPSSELREAQTLKFPVGRFSSSKGLKLTLTLEDGSELVKYVYKTGISTFTESDGNFQVMHLARALFPFSGGISDAADLVAFASAVNNGGSLLEYMNDEGKVVLLDNIDMNGVNWTPIGNARTSSHQPTDGNAFTGHFDGQGFSILNISLTPDFASTQQDGRLCGLFGFANGATIENLTIGAPENDNSKLVFSANGTADAGVFVGMCRNTTIRNCTNYVPMNVRGNAVNEKRTTMGAFAGYLYSGADEESLLENLTNYGSMTASQGSNTHNGANGVMCGGIAGHVNADNAAKGNTIRNCVNYGDITSGVSRSCGIIAGANNLTQVVACKNYGNQVNTGKNIRVGMITSIVASNCALRDCENYGNLTLTQCEGGSTQGGGLVCLLSQPTAEITGGGNYGTIIGDILANTDASTRYIGLIAANYSKIAKVDGVEAGGQIGTYNGGSPEMVSLNKSNYMDYIGRYTGEYAAKITNIIYKGPDAVGIKTAADLMEFASLVNQGKSYSKFQNLSGVVSLLNDIDMSGKTWTPIGQAVYTLASNKLTFTEDNSFKGHFNGNGFKIKNLDMVCTNSTAISGYGLFGVLGSGAVVENVVMDESSSLTINASAQTDCGVVAGLVYEATVKDIVNYAPITYNTGATAKRMTMGVVGLAFANTSDAVVSGITNHASVTAAEGGNMENGGNGVHAATILGFGTTQAESSTNVYVRNCVNHGNVVSATGRAATIVGACNRYTTIDGCKNYGSVTNSFSGGASGRIGAITVILGAGSKIYNTENHGDVICTKGAGAASIACLINNADCQLENVRNYGDVITDHKTYKGTFFGQCNNASIFRDCVCQGDLGTYNGGSYKMTGVNAVNYFDYIGSYDAHAVYVTPLNIRWGDQAVQTAPTFPALWQFSATSRQLYESEWVNNNRIPCTYSSPATISVVRAEANAGKAFTCMAEDGSGTSARPYVGNLLKDDYWLWTLPVDYVPAGTYVLFNVTLAGGQDSPKYYILEYFDQGEWKQANLLRTISEDTSKKYSFAVFGVQNGGKYQHSTFTHVLQFEDEFINSTMKIRLRVPADISCSGGKLSLDSADGTCSLAPMGFTGSYVNIMGNKAPKDTKRVLAIGNSFSHYHDPSWKLVEIAFAEGHKIEMFGHFKGSQTFANHLELWLTTVAINMGKFHYAFIQDQSSAHANYASDKTANAATLTNSQALKDKILAKVSTCNVILENTWSFAGSAGNYGGFTSFENFDDLLLSGSLSIAKSIGSPVSPIGQAFKLAREKHPEIELYDDDVKHQGPYGAYLKACVNYLVLYGEPFGSTPADCGLNPTTTAKLRAVAEETVLGNESKYYITR